MLDISFIRDNHELIAEAARKKKSDFKITELLSVDDERRELLSVVEGMRSKQNEHSKLITSAATQDERTVYIQEMQSLKEELQKDEEKLKEVMQRWRALMLMVPNIPDMSVPEGKDESENVEVKTWGTIPNFEFEVKDHVDLMTSLGMVDFERGVKVHGFRGYFLKGAGANLSWALWNYARDFYGPRDFEQFIAPVVVRPEYFYGTGHLPNEAEDLYKTQDDDYLAGTAEVPMMAYHADEMLEVSDLPKKYLAYTPCYRREAGSYGKDTRGLIRVHEFYKIEQLVLCEASHAESEKWHQEITNNFEGFLESLGLPYRRLLICTGDLSQSKVKQFDIEVWTPAQNTYREAASASYFHDFQTRRFNTRYRDSEGKVRYVHSLNNTALATPRLIAALVELNQQADGSVKIPEVLRPYMNGQSEIKG